MSPEIFDDNKSYIDWKTSLEGDISPIWNIARIADEYEQDTGPLSVRTQVISV